MNDKQLGEALVKLDAADLADVSKTQKQTWQILEQDRRRVRWWTALTILAWLPAIVGIMGVLVYLGLLFPLQAKLQQIRDAQKVARPAERNTHDPDVHERNSRKLNFAQLERDADIGFKMMSVLTGLSVFALCLALLASVLLMFATRRATLRQINANLLVISEQLKRLEAGR